MRGILFLHVHTNAQIVYQEKTHLRNMKLVCTRQHPKRSANIHDIFYRNRRDQQNDRQMAL